MAKPDDLGRAHGSRPRRLAGALGWGLVMVLLVLVAFAILLVLAWPELRPAFGSYPF